MDTKGFAVQPRSALPTAAAAEEHGAFVVLHRPLRHAALGVAAGQAAGVFLLQNEALVRLRRCIRGFAL